MKLDSKEYRQVEQNILQEWSSKLKESTRRKLKTLTSQQITE